MTAGEVEKDGVQRWDQAMARCFIVRRIPRAHPVGKFIILFENPDNKSKHLTKATKYIAESLLNLGYDLLIIEMKYG